MLTEDQTTVVEFLSSPVAHQGSSVERIETHASIVFLAGPRAYKLKRAVRFDYLDFSTADRRRALCEAELALNRRTAPMLYRGVVAITRDPHGNLSIGGDGAPVDWVVVMNRFPQEALLDRLAIAGRLDLDLMAPLADAIVALYASAERRDDHGGSRGMAWVVEGNASGLAEFTPACVDAGRVAELVAATRGELARRAPALDGRRAAGFVRQCHGDLHLRNIALLDGRPTLFDGVEFNDEIACTDVVYDLSFLLMDLWRRRLPRHANAIWNRFLSATGDFGAVSLLPLFLSCRAAVRAKTSATAAMQEHDARRGELCATAREYLEMGRLLLRPVTPMLVAVGGLSGTGKSTLAYAAAPSIGAVPGAVVLRSDEIRKRLHGVASTARLAAAAYTPELSRRVYATIAADAIAILRDGHSVIADAVYLEPAARQEIAQAAANAATPFAGLWLDAPETTMMTRIANRRNDASDADAAVVRRQQAQGVGTITWQHLDASVAPTGLLSAALAHLLAIHPASIRESL